MFKSNTIKIYAILRQLFYVKKEKKTAIVTSKKIIVLRINKQLEKNMQQEARRQS